MLTLLRYDAGSETFLQQAVALERPLVPEGERFGPYELGPLLGRGGMGAVFRAERVDGELHQTVAIKIVERGWLDPRAIERFRVERQILASLVHPNIARLLDGGTRDDGLPYLVMEFVDGLRLDQYCDQHALPLAARLSIFLPLCDAVDYAHRKLIVHRLSPVMRLAMARRLHELRVPRVGHFMRIHVIRVEIHFVVGPIVQQHPRTHFRLIVRREPSAAHAEFAGWDQNHLIGGEGGYREKQQQDRYQTNNSTISSSMTNSVAPSTSM